MTANKARKRARTKQSAGAPETPPTPANEADANKEAIAEYRRHWEEEDAREASEMDAILAATPADPSTPPPTPERIYLRSMQRWEAMRRSESIGIMGQWNGGDLDRKINAYVDHEMTRPPRGLTPLEAYAVGRFREFAIRHCCGVPHFTTRDAQAEARVEELAFDLLRQVVDINERFSV